MVEGQVPGETNMKAAGRRPSSVSAEAVREELSRVLACHEFRLSKRTQDFVRYVVEHTLSGREDMLKERTIGIEVFGRSTSYEPSDDATVRVKAGDVRKRLGLYYAEEGARNPVRIELPPGTYVPEFRWSETKSDRPKSEKPLVQVAVSDLSTGAPPLALKPQSRRNWYVIIGAVMIAIVIAAAVWTRLHPASTELDLFWAPVLKGASPVSLCVAFVPVYGLNRDPASAKPASADDFVLLTDQFVGGGDLVASSRISAMLARMRHPYHLTIGSDVSFQDLRAAPAILWGIRIPAGKKSAVRCDSSSIRRESRSGSPITARSPN
jgi:hypothetical protein